MICSLTMDDLKCLPCFPDLMAKLHVGGTYSRGSDQTRKTAMLLR